MTTHLFKPMLGLGFGLWRLEIGRVELVHKLVCLFQLGSLFHVSTRDIPCSHRHVLERLWTRLLPLVQKTCEILLILASALPKH